MALDTLFTFWPPAPWARIGVSSISWSPSVVDELMRIGMAILKIRP